MSQNLSFLFFLFFFFVIFSLSLRWVVCQFSMYLWGLRKRQNVTGDVGDVRDRVSWVLM